MTIHLDISEFNRRIIKHHGDLMALKAEIEAENAAKDDEGDCDEEHANSSAANYKDYMAEERATTDRGNK